MTSNAATVEDYLQRIEEEPRRQIMSEIRAQIRAHCPSSTETMSSGLPAYEWGGMLFAWASQKQHLAFYVCEDQAVRDFVARTGHKNCGKGCIRFSTKNPIAISEVAQIVRQATAIRGARLQEPGPDANLSCKPAARAA